MIRSGPSLGQWSMLRLTLILTLLATGPVAALSCRPFTFADAFDRAAAAEEIYSLGFGVLSTQTPLANSREPAEVPARFEGQLLGLRGFGDGQVIEITIEKRCASAWCGQMPQMDVPALVLLQHDGAERKLISDLCDRDFLTEPSFGQVSAIKACMRAGHCGTDEHEAFTQR